MPRAAAAPFNEQLDALLQAKRVSQRELAKRLAAIDGTKPESKRRWLQKVLAGDVEPTNESVGSIEQALGAPGHFKRRAAALVPSRGTRRDHLRALEDEVALLRKDHTALLGLAATVDDLQTTVDDLKNQVAALQRRPAAGRRASGGR